MHSDKLRIDAEKLIDSRCIDLLSQLYTHVAALTSM